MCTVKPESSVRKTQHPTIELNQEHQEIPSDQGRRELSQNLKFLDKNEKKLEDSPQLQQNVIYTKIIPEQRKCCLMQDHLVFILAL